MANASRPRLAALTSARFVAAFHVLLFHAWAMQGLTRAPSWLQRFASVGYVAVSFFFILSGFILVYTYEGKEFDWRQFWKARLARLYPVYLLSLLITAPFFFYVVLRMNVVQLAYFKSHLPSTAVLVLTMMQAWVPMAALGWNGVAWAVSVEIFFYMTFPSLLRRFAGIGNRGLACIALSSWMLIILLDLVYVVLSPDREWASSSTDFLFWLSAVKFHPFMRLPEFIVGLACGYWFVRGGQNPRLATPLVLGGTIVALTTTTFSDSIPYPIMHTGLFAPAFAAIIFGLALQPSWAGFLESRWLVLLGESSYCFYLFHVTILGAFLFANRDPSATPSWLRIFGGMATATIAGLLIFRFVEEPTRKWLRGRPVPHPATGRAIA
jgi:peptidoglycan/LPS O-acetylase OafA/YrhL